MSAGEPGRVLVAGGGIGGLTLAHGLARRGVEVQVYEADEDVDVRTQGYRIGLGPRAFEILSAHLPERLSALVTATSGGLTGPGLMFDDQLNLLDDDMEGPPPEAMAIDRQVFRQTLLTGLGDRIHYGKRLTGFTEEPGGPVVAAFADGSSASGGVLVGADGGGSAVRRQLLPHIGLEESPLGGVMGRTSITDQFRRLVPGRGTMIKGGGVTLMLGRMEFGREPSEAAADLAPDARMPHRDGYVRWVLMLPPDHPEAGRREQGDTREFVHGLLASWHPDILALIDAADMAAIGRAPILDQPVTAWPQSRVVLMGDSAHLTLASGGNGANTAIEDARLLCDGLVAVGNGERELLPMLTAYQADMLARGNAAVEFSKEALKRFVPARP
jgi:2-polyprenyl-6-methoxyphenol hydroxylase-like FAD-dependent oxidoreductase